MQRQRLRVQLRAMNHKCIKFSQESYVFLQTPTAIFLPGGTAFRVPASWADDSFVKSSEMSGGSWLGADCGKSKKAAPAA